MENLEKLIEMADTEFGAIAKNGKFRSREEIDTVYKLVDIVKDAYCIMSDEEDGYSNDDDMSMAYRRGGDRGGDRGSYRRSYAYDDGSYARGRGRYAKRDSMGRYSRDGGSYRDGGYSRADGKADYMEHLREMMEDAPDEQTRMSIKRMIDQMEQ